MWKKEEAPGNFFGMKSVWPMSKTVTKNHNESKTENLQTAGKRWRGGGKEEDVEEEEEEE